MVMIHTKSGRKKLWFGITLGILLAFSGCGREDESALDNEHVTVSTTDEQTAAGEAGNETVSDDTSVSTDFEEYIEWVVPSLAEVSDETLVRFNQILAERGCDFGLRLTVLDLFEYNIFLQGGKTQHEISPDIAFTGLTDSEGVDIPGQLIASGYFECLDSYLLGSRLYAAVPKKMWDSVKYEGSVYTVPNGMATDGEVRIYFDLDKVSREDAENFQGDISKLQDILGRDGKLLYSMGQFLYTSYYDCTYWNGAVVSREGEVTSVFENNDCMAWLRTINRLYLSGRATNDKSADWSVMIAKGTSPEKENIYCYSTKSVLNTRYSASTGIVSTSERKEKAFRLLELLHTDSELGNCLIYGADYVEKDGYAVDAKGNMMKADMKKLIFGLNASVLWDEGADASIKYASIQDKLDYYDQNVVESPIIGMTFKTDVTAVKQILTMEVLDALWKSDDLEGEIERLKAQLDETNLSELIEEIKGALSEG